jgi:hypothetical protein
MSPLPFKTIIIKIESIHYDILLSNNYKLQKKGTSNFSSHIFKDMYLNANLPKYRKLTVIFSSSIG